MIDFLFWHLTGFGWLSFTTEQVNILISHMTACVNFSQLAFCFAVVA